MPATSKAQQRAMCMALAARKGDLDVSKLKGAALEIYKSKMTNKEIEDFTVMESLRKYTNRNMKNLKDYINESILSSTKSGKYYHGWVNDIREYIPKKQYAKCAEKFNKDNVFLNKVKNAVWDGGKIFEHSFFLALTDFGCTKPLVSFEYDNNEICIIFFDSDDNMKNSEYTSKNIPDIYGISEEEFFKLKEEIIDLLKAKKNITKSSSGEFESYYAKIK
jgi:hypothetical protein